MGEPSETTVRLVIIEAELIRLRAASDHNTALYRVLTHRIEEHRRNCPSAHFRPRATERCRTHDPAGSGP